MTLKEKFKLPIDANNKINDYVAKQCEEIAEDLAIGFADWCCSKYTKLHSVWCPIFGDQRDKNNWKTTKELLKIFKKEKQLCD